MTFAPQVLKRRDLKMSNSSSSASGGIGFFGLLTIVLLILKVLGKISISWFWVFSPIIFSFVLTILFLIVVFAIAIVVGMLK